MTHATDVALSITGAIENDGQIFRNPKPRYSIDETVDYHVILDQELDQLARPENGVIGTVGFTALGAALGFLPAMVAILQKIVGAAREPLIPIEITTLLLTPACGIAALICLILFFISKFRNRGLVTKIKKRPRKSAN
ncbi:cytochrome c biogenesis protein CcdA [Sinorhizobium fredii]